MISPKYTQKIKSTISSFDPQRENKYFLFGSATRKEKFGDVDVGVMGNARSAKNLADLREQFEESTLPYFVDVVDFDAASSEFTEYVRSAENLVWLN